MGRLTREVALALAGTLPAGIEASAELGVPVSVPPTLVGPEVLGRVYEALLAPVQRRRSGSFFTPADVAAGVVDLALSWSDVEHPTVCDPTAGGGAFLLAAADALHARGLPRSEVVGRCLFGADIDPLAARTARDALRLWAAEDGSIGTPHVVVADTSGGAIGTRSAVEGFDLVVGNPPFLGQLRTATTRSAPELARLRAAFPGVVQAYTDPAAVFLLGALRLVRPGGVSALVVPESILTARDARGVRSALALDGDLAHLWVADEAVFGPNVRVCVPVVVRGPRTRPTRVVTRSVGRSFRATSSVRLGAEDDGSWGSLLDGLRGVPTVSLPERGTLGDRATITAGFRDQYYGVQDHVVEDSEVLDDRTHPRLVTSGLIDPATCRWGVRAATFARRRWSAPRVDLDGLARVEPALHRWALGQLVPKVVVATQTRLLEAAVDELGCWYPSTPTVSVVPEPTRLWEVAAVLLAPPVSAWLHGRLAGSGLAPGHLRISATQLRAVPLPADDDLLAEGAILARSAAFAVDDDQRLDALERLGLVMNDAYRADGEVLEWWLAQLRRVMRPEAARVR